MRSLLIMLIVVAFGRAEVTAGDAPFRGVTLTDHLSQSHDLEKETAGHLVMLFAIESRVDGKAWDERLSAQLPADRQLVRVMDAGAIAEEDRPRLLERVKKALDGTRVTFVMDWQGAVRKQLGGTADQVVIVAVDAQGTVSGRTGGLPTAANLTTALGFLGIVPMPPLTDDKTANPKTDPKHTP
jgi:hypothetical protein